MTQKQKSIPELFDELKQWNAAYRMGEPMVSDKEYDARFESLKSLDPENPWFKAIEPAPVKKSRKRSLPLPMKSLEKVKTFRELRNWLKDVATTDYRVVIMPKFDGLSLLFDERTREGWTRGGAENEGQDCTRHCTLLTHMHNHNPDNGYAYTFGEFVFSRKNWEEHFAGRNSRLTGDPYKSPRNTAAGLLNRDEPEREIAFAEYYRYGVDEHTLGYYRYFSEVIQDLCDDFGQRHMYYFTDRMQLSEELMETLYRQWAESYYIDGLVVYVDNLASWRRLGRKPNGNPAYAIAYKHPNFTDNFETTVTGINWVPAKSGALKPTVAIKEVDTGDCIMKQPTGNNARWLKERGIAKGAKVLVTRSGGVIPKILSTFVRVSKEDVERAIPDRCPSCGSPTVWEGPDITCTNPCCPGRMMGKVRHFFVTMGIEGVGEKQVEKLFEAGYDSLPKILSMTSAQVNSINGFGDTMADILYYERLRMNEGTPLSTLMHASDCFRNVGKAKAEKELDAMSQSELDAFIDGSWDMTAPTPGTPEYLALTSARRALVDGYRDFMGFIAENRLKPLMPKRVRKTDDHYAGFVVCFSGIRDLDTEERIKAGGGRVSTSVNKTTTHLVVKKEDQVTSKTERARELGVKIYNLDDFNLL